MTKSASDLTLELESLLQLTREELKLKYSEFRILLTEILKVLALHPSILPLFPERSHGEGFRKLLYESQGRTYASTLEVDLPDWAIENKEKWVPVRAKITSLDILGERHIYFSYEYSVEGQIYRHAYNFEQDFMHQLTSFWNEAELLKKFSSGMEIPCQVSADNFSRHKIWTPY